MCPPVEDTPVNGANGHANGVNGSNSSNNHPGYTNVSVWHMLFHEFEFGS